MGHAKALLSLEDAHVMEEMAVKIVAGDILVRDIEKMARDSKKQKQDDTDAKPLPQPKEQNWGDSFYKEMEIALSAELGRKVRIQNQGKKSIIELEFYSDEELNDIAARLTKGNG